MCTVDHKLRRIAALKPKVGDFSLHVFYDEGNPGNPHTAKIFWPNGSTVTFLGRSSSACLNQAEQHLRDRLEKTQRTK